MTKKETRSQPLYQPGTKVCVQHAERGSDAAREYGLITGREYCVVVSAHWEPVIECWQYYLACFGRRGFPKKQPIKPYILRYLEPSLRKCGK